MVSAESVPEPVDVPRPPAYAWDWLQRSRPVVERLARVLTGRPAGRDLVVAVRRSFATDPLVRDAVLRTVSEVAFRDRVPRRRPPGASWDRGLVWWAATLVGSTPTEYDRGGRTAVEQPPLFGDEPPTPPTVERRVVVAALRGLLAEAVGDQIPAAAVRQLVAHLDGGDARPRRAR